MNVNGLHEAAALAGRAAAWPMAAWLRPLPDGRTVKQGFAELAARARQLQLQSGSGVDSVAPASGASDDAELAGMVRERERRTVGVLVREAHEALRALASRAAAAEIAEPMDAPGLRALTEMLRECVAAAEGYR